MKKEKSLFYLIFGSIAALRCQRLQLQHLDGHTHTLAAGVSAGRQTEWDVGVECDQVIGGWTGESVYSRNVQLLERWTGTWMTDGQLLIHSCLITRRRGQEVNFLPFAEWLHSPGFKHLIPCISQFALLWYSIKIVMCHI